METISSNQLTQNVNLGNIEFIRMESSKVQSLYNFCLIVFVISFGLFFVLFILLYNIKPTV